MRTSRRSIPPEAARKTIHLLAGSLPLIYAQGVARGTILGLLWSVSVVALATEWARRAWPDVRASFDRRMGPMLREHEHRAITGATWLALASLSAVLFLPASPAIAVLWCTAVADPVAGIVGRAWRKRARPGARAVSGKTPAGSFACAVAAFAGAWVIADLAPGRALVVALAATLAERYPGPFDDNITVAVGVALAAIAMA